ncbi:MAG: DEAD/DEAH box helicase [Gemmatimonadota bacterium]|nr:MAG: DEAD/DEAH box helicase [Gemmatimonadota bacterium]
MPRLHILAPSERFRTIDLAATSDPSERTQSPAAQGPSVQELTSEGAAFAALGLSPRLVDAVLHSGYSEPTEVQRQAVPAALEGRDLLATAHTGTGKTAAFTLPMIQRLGEDAIHGRPRGLVITPTRELAQQVGAAVESYGVTSDIECVVVHGGTNVRSEGRELSYGCDVLVATPGRLLDHLRRGTVDLGEVEVLVLDEADRMLDMGFIDDVKRIVAATPQSRQTLLFSATMPNGVLWLANEMMRDPVRVEVGLERAADGIRQVLYPVDWPAKHKLLLHLLEERTSGQVLIFTRRRDTTTYLTEFLLSRDVSVDDLHGGKPQRLRDVSLEGFRNGQTRVLVATNVAARGLDVRGIRHVVNFDVPDDPRDYVHRVGRTARGDDTGEAITLMSPNDWHLVRDIERLMGEPIHRETVEGFEPSVAIPATHAGELTVATEPARVRTGLTRGIRRR